MDDDACNGRWFDQARWSSRLNAVYTEKKNKKKKYIQYAPNSDNVVIHTLYRYTCDEATPTPWKISGVAALLRRRRQKPTGDAAWPLAVERQEPLPM